MRRLQLFWFILLVMTVLMTMAYGQPVDETPETLPVSGIDEGWGTLVWRFFNSPLGITMVAFGFSVLVGKVFTWKPKWEQYVSKYYPLLMTAVKYAEKKIPDDTLDAGLARLNKALKYIQSVHASLDSEAVKLALMAVHAEAEADGNLKQ